MWSFPFPARDSGKNNNVNKGSDDINDTEKARRQPRDFADGVCRERRQVQDQCQAGHAPSLQHTEDTIKFRDSL